MIMVHFLIKVTPPLNLLATALQDRYWIGITSESKIVVCHSREAKRSLLKQVEESSDILAPEDEVFFRLVQIIVQLLLTDCRFAIIKASLCVDERYKVRNVCGVDR